MTMIIAHPRDLLGKAGSDLGVTDWLLIDQTRIDMFAAATGDHQWLHVDPVRAKDGPFGTTIAHGYLTLALVNMFLPQLIEVRHFSSGFNIGADGLRFLAPVPVDARIRGKGEIIRVEQVKAGAIQSTVRIAIEIEGATKPACVVDTISRYIPEPDHV